MSNRVTTLNEALAGRYRIERELGEGGMATVYLAEDLRHGRRVALKVLKPELAAVVGAARFLAEIRTTAKLQHPHILPLHDSGDVDGVLFYVMPYMEGESLRERLDRERQLSVDEAVRIATAVAQALDYAHRHGVVHRDVKPANILLHDGEPVISDFGIALAVSAGGPARLTQAGLGLGTPVYMSPEQATGDQSVGPATDVWALGCVLYEMLAGEPPYTGSTPQAILGRILGAGAERVIVHRTSVPPHVEAVVDRALQKVPADRFASAGDMARALADPTPRLEVGRARDRAERDGGQHRDGPYFPRRAIAGALLALAAAGLGAAGWMLLGGASGRPETIAPSVAVLPFEDLSPEGDQRYFVEGLSEEIINALAQLPDLKVAARTSAFLLAEQGADIATVSSTLGVGNVLEGSVRKSGDRIRITAQLIEAESGFHLWSQTFDRDLTDIFEVQDDIARAIADQLQVTLAAGVPERLVAEPTGSRDAHEAYLLGRYFLSQRTEASVGNAITEFERAIDLDPRYAEAYSGLADAYLLVETYASPGRSVESRAREGLEAARTAVSLAPALGMARISLGYGLLRVGEWEGSERELRRAIELSPGDANARRTYAQFLYTTGRPGEAVPQAERALELDPVTSTNSLTLARALWFSGRTEAAMEQWRQTSRLASTLAFPWSDLARALFDLGRYDEGREAWLVWADLVGGDERAYAEAWDAAVRSRTSGEPQPIADFGLRESEGVWLLARTGQHADAIDMLRREWFDVERYGYLALIHVWFGSSLLGDDPAYHALMREAAITW